MITIFNGSLSSEHLALARHQNDAIKIPLTIYYSNVEEYKFSAGFTVDTGEELIQRYRDYFWINKPEPPMQYFCGYKAGVRPGSIEQRYSAGYKVRFAERIELRFRSLFRRHFLLGEKLRYNYKAGFKFKLGATRLRLNYRTAFKVVNRKEDPLVLSYKCSYKYSRRSESEYRYTDAFNVTLINRVELNYHTGYRHSVSKFVFPRKYNTNAAGVNTTVAELPIPWKVIKQKDGSSGIRIALDKSKLDLGSDGLRIYINFPPKYINYCAVMRGKFDKLPDIPVAPKPAAPINNRPGEITETAPPPISATPSHIIEALPSPGGSETEEET